MYCESKENPIVVLTLDLNASVFECLYVQFYFVIIEWYEFTSYSFLFFILPLQKHLDLQKKKENKLDQPLYNLTM